MVRFCVLPSLKVPVAANCSLVPFAIEELPALIAIDCRVAAVTERGKVLEVIPLCVALTLLEPVPTPEAKPAAMLTAAALDELQVAEFVRF